MSKQHSVELGPEKRWEVLSMAKDLWQTQALETAPLPGQLRQLLGYAVVPGVQLNPKRQPGQLGRQAGPLLPLHMDVQN